VHTELNNYSELQQQLQNYYEIKTATNTHTEAVINSTNRNVSAYTSRNAAIVKLRVSEVHTECKRVGLL